MSVAARCNASATMRLECLRLVLAGRLPLSTLPVLVFLGSGLGVLYSEEVRKGIASAMVVFCGLCLIFATTVGLSGNAFSFCSSLWYGLCKDSLSPSAVLFSTYSFPVELVRAKVRVLGAVRLGGVAGVGLAAIPTIRSSRIVSGFNWSLERLIEGVLRIGVSGLLSKDT